MFYNKAIDFLIFLIFLLPIFLICINEICCRKRLDNSTTVKSMFNVDLERYLPDLDH